MTDKDSKRFVLQVWEGGSYITKTRPANYWDTCKAADSYKKEGDLTGWCRVVEVGEAL